MQIQRPPETASDELTEYLYRQFKIVEDELNGANGVSILKELPARPRLGKIYYINGGDDAGYWIWEGEWRSIVSVLKNAI